MSNLCKLYIYLSTFIITGVTLACRVQTVDCWDHSLIRRVDGPSIDQFLSVMHEATS